MTIKKVLVIGGTGMIGKPVAERLAVEGFDVSIGSRSVDSIRRVFGEKFPAVAVQVTDPESLRKALQDFDAVHLNLPSGPRFKDCFETETSGAKTLASVVKDTSIKRISYITGAGVNADQTFPPARAKWLAEEAIRACGVPFTIWRPSWFFETLHKTVRFGSVGMLGKGNVQAHWLGASDLGGWIAKALNDERTANKTFYAFGSRNYSYKDIAQVYRDLCHPKMKILSAPIWFVSLMGSLTRNWDMWFGAQMFKYLENEPEAGDPSEAVQLLGELNTSIEEWCRSQDCGN